MHLYISSIKKKILIVVFVLLGYVLLVIFVPRYENGVEQWQTNLLRAQDYVFLLQECDAVLVGSSEMYRIPTNICQHYICNLAFSGRSSMTGIEIILENEKKAKVVYVEVNETLLREIDEEILDKVDSGLNFLFLERNRPDYLFMSIYRPYIDKLTNKWSTSSIKADDDMIENYVASETDLIEEEKLELALQLLKEKVDMLILEGYDVVLVETPNDNRIYYAPRKVQVRDFLLRLFPMERYNWIQVDWEDYETVDGEHLNHNSAKKFARYIDKDISSRI